MDDRTLARRYALQELLGSSGVGEVWRAYDQTLRRAVAVKVLTADLTDRSATARFRAEATAAAKVRHPNAVTVYDFGRDQGHDYLVMELVEGGTLDDVLEAAPLAPEVAAGLGEQIARGLGAAHARELVHRDVTPSNVLLTREGIAKVADFGIARWLGEAASGHTAPGSIVGTARFLAPEQLRDQHIDARADVYAVGLVLYQLLTGEPPFGEGTSVELALRRLADRLPRVSERRPEVPAALDDAVARATDPDPANRFANGDELATALAGLAAPDAAQTIRGLLPGSQPPEETVPSGGMPPHDASATLSLAPAGRSDHGDPSTSAPPATDSDRPAPLEPSPPAAPAARTTSVRQQPAPPPRSGRPPPPDFGRYLAQVPPWVRSWPLAVAVAALLAVSILGFGAALLTGGPSRPEPADQGEEVAGGTAGDQEDPGVDGGGTTVEVIEAGDFDPFGDGAEHPEEVGNAFDGDAATEWQTQGYYGDPALGGLKPGVGIWFDLGSAHEIAEIEVHTSHPGASFTVFAGDAAPGRSTPPESWGTPAGTVEHSEPHTRLELDEPTEGRVWLLWFTSLPSDGGEFRGAVSDVTFTAGP